VAPPSKPGGPSYSYSGRLGYITGQGANAINVAISPDHREGMIEVGSERFFTRDTADVDAAIRALRLLRQRLRPRE
jgi:ribosomal protein L21E